MTRPNDVAELLMHAHTQAVELEVALRGLLQNPTLAQVREVRRRLTNSRQYDIPSLLGHVQRLLEQTK